MSDGIVIALISGGLSVLGYVIGAYLSQSKTLYRIDQLEKKVDKHNNVIERTYKLEQKVDDLEKKVN